MIWNEIDTNDNEKRKKTLPTVLNVTKQKFSWIMEKIVSFFTFCGKSFLLILFVIQVNHRYGKKNTSFHIEIVRGDEFFYHFHCEEVPHKCKAITTLAVWLKKSRQSDIVREKKWKFTDYCLCNGIIKMEENFGRTNEEKVASITVYFPSYWFFRWLCGSFFCLSFISTSLSWISAWKLKITDTGW